jgi:CheY-like chemotaxis protein
LSLSPPCRGQLGFDLAVQHSPDLILLDLHLPDLPGWTVLEKLQRHLATSQIPVVVISADATKRQMDKLLAAGARSYLTKPIALTEFYRVIEDTVATEVTREPAAA